MGMGQAMVDVDFYQREIVGDSLLIDDSVRQDSLRKIVAQRAARWVETVKSRGSVPLVDMESMALLDNRADRVSAVDTTLQQVLRTPGLSVDDRMHTLSLGVTLLMGDGKDPKRFARAGWYIRQLDAMGPSALRRRYGSRLRLISVFYNRSNSAAVVAQGDTALLIAQQIPYAQRAQLVYIYFPYERVVEAMSGLPNPRPRIIALNDRIRALLRPTAAELARDSTLAHTPGYGKYMEKKIAQYAMIGTSAPVIQLHRWANRGSDTAFSPSPRSIALADGVIRILEFGDRGCIPCQLSLPEMNWLHKQLAIAGMEMIYVTKAGGSWNYELTSPEHSSEMLVRYYREAPNNYVFPMAIWAGEKVPNDEGGMVPKDSPNDPAFQINAEPTFVFVDGHGIIRRIGTGYQQGKAREALTFMRYLRAEAGQHAAKPPIPRDGLEGERRTNGVPESEAVPVDRASPGIGGIR